MKRKLVFLAVFFLGRKCIDSLLYQAWACGLILGARKLLPRRLKRSLPKSHDSGERWKIVNMFQICLVLHHLVVILYKCSGDDHRIGPPFRLRLNKTTCPCLLYLYLMSPCKMSPRDRFLLTQNITNQYDLTYTLPLPCRVLLQDRYM